MHYAIAAFLAIHGIAHVVGFVVPWRLAKLKEMPYSTRLLGGNLDVGDAGIRFVGLLWLIAALVYFVVACSIALLSPWWITGLLGATVFSLLLCVLGWPHSRIGLVIDVGILAVYVTFWILGWSLLPSLG